MNIRLTIFDKHHPVLKDPRVRRAMTHAVDRQAIVDALWSGRTKVPKGLQWDFFGPMLLGDWAAPAFDPAEAKKLLKEAGYDGAPIPYQMLNNYYTNQLQTAQIMVEQWKAVGLNVVIEMKENWAQILGRFPGRGICENSNSSWFNDPVASLSAYAPGGQTWEAGQWENDEMIKLTAALQDSTDLQKRRADFRRMLTILEREDPCYNVVHQNATFTAKRRDYKWRPAQSFVFDFRASNWGFIHWSARSSADVNILAQRAVHALQTIFHCTSVKGGLASSCGSNTACTSAPIFTSCCGIAQKVAEHADVAGIGQLDQHDDVRTVALQRRMHRMPRPLPAVDAALARHLVPIHVEGQALVADPFRPPLERAAFPAALDHQLAAARRLPVRLVEPVILRHRRRQAVRQVAHSVASEPRIMLETGVTIGPEITIDTSASLHLRRRLAAQLAHRLDLQLEAVHVAFGQVAARGVERQLA